jgi:putative RecB family exonuclease
MTPPPVATAPTQTKPVADPALSPMEGMAWTTDAKGNWGLTATETKTLSRLRREELSASTSFNLDVGSCAVGMAAGRLIRDDDGPFEANQLGTAAHGVLEHLMSLPPEQRTKYESDQIAKRFRTDREFVLIYLDEDLADKVHALEGEELETWYGEVRRRVYGLWDIEDPTTITVHSNEMAFGARHGREVKIGKVPFVGFIDRVDKVLNLTTGEVEGYKVIDYKAGKFKDGSGKFGDDYGDQIRIYIVAVTEAEGIVPSSGALYFITYGKARNIDISPEAIAGTVKKFERAYDRMNKLADDNFYPTKAGPLCSWCPLVNACPVAVAAGKKDLSDTDKDAKGVRYVVEGKKKKGLSPIALGIPTVGAPVVLDASAVTVTETKVIAETTQAERGAAHIPDEQPAAVTPKITKPTVKKSTVTKKESTTMTTTAPSATTAFKIKEGVNGRSAIDQDGTLFGNSDAAAAVWDLSSLAVEQLAANGQTVNAPNVLALTATYAKAVQEVQFALAGTSSYQEGVNARVRFALRTSVETFPAPWGGDAAAWAEYATSIKKRAGAISNTAVKLFGLGTELPDTPWAALASAPAA